MANVQFGGLITGLDVNALITGLVKAERQSINVLQSQKVRYQAQDAVITSLIGALGSLKSSAENLSLSTDFIKRSATSSDTTVLTAGAASTALLGTSVITVDTLATAKSVKSASFADSGSAIGTGTLTITVGSVGTSVVINGTNNTLAGLRDAINNSGAKVNASIVNVGTSTPDYRLVVQSKDTGTANAVTISGTLAGGTDPFPAGGEVVQAAADAKFAVNGLTLTRSSNTISDALAGVTLVLVKEGDRDGVIEATDAIAKVTVASDSAALTSKIKKLVEDFNAVNKIVNDQFTINPNSKRQGAAAGDASLRGVMSRLRNELSAPGGGTSVKYRTLSDIGITFQKNGSLSLDDAKLSAAFAEDATAVSQLFIAVQNGVGKRIADAVDDFVSAVDGALTFRQKGIGQSIKRIDDKVAREETRIAVMEERLTKQFSALEKLVSDLKSQGDFLSQQLNRLRIER
jgi:flagellar hook-associated protein 2